MPDVRALNELVARESAFLDQLMAEVARSSSARPTWSSASSSGCSRAGTCCSRVCPAWPRRSAVKTLSDTLEAKFARVQFTPDLLPADLVGTVIYNHQKGEFTSKLGPIFANLVLADEINRAPAKVQSALLEAMQERQVTIGDHDLQAARSLRGHGDAEPDRARGHLSPARGAGRPLHAHGEGGLPHAPRRAPDHRSRDQPGQGHPRRGPRRSARARAQGRARRLHGRSREGLHRGGGVRHARARAEGPARAGEPHRVRLLAARLDRPRARRARPRVPCDTAAT
jgi:hypothetical protein